MGLGRWTDIGPRGCWSCDASLLICQGPILAKKSVGVVQNTPSSSRSSPPPSDRIRASNLQFTSMIPQVSSNPTSLTTKERHYAQLAAKLGTLANSFETTRQHLNLAAEQAFYMRKLGIAQAST